MEELKNKRFLITQPMIGGLCGSTMVTLELADFLQSSGATVTVYTNYYGGAAKTFFKAKNISVKTFDEEPQFKLGNFDFIWVHSQILPISIIKDLEKEHKKLPVFIFLHMSSAKRDIPDEFPWIYDLEKRVASLRLFISEGTKRAQLKFLSDDDKIPYRFFRNPAPVELNNRSSIKTEKPSSILIVSNHPPKEIIEAKEILKSQGIDVVSLGDYQDDYTIITPEVLSKFDAVVTIGKSVQYCLVSGTPVYIYDHYGGSGWLNEDNFESAKKINFSGWCDIWKTPEVIAKEIVGQYSSALRFHQTHQKDFQKDFSIEHVLPEVLKNITPRKIQKLDRTYAKSVVLAETFAKVRFCIGEEAADIRKYSESLVKHSEILEKCLSAKSYRLYNKLIKPYALLKSKIQKNRELHD